MLGLSHKCYLVPLLLQDNKLKSERYSSTGNVVQIVGPLCRRSFFSVPVSIWCEYDFFVLFWRVSRQLFLVNSSVRLQDIPPEEHRRIWDRNAAFNTDACTLSCLSRAASSQSVQTCWWHFFDTHSNSITCHVRLLHKRASVPKSGSNTLMYGWNVRTLRESY